MLGRMITITIMCLFVFSFVQAENYAVLITGETPLYDALGVKTWGDPTDPGPYDEFWSDTFLMWETLWNYGWKDENIFVLFGDGEDWNSPYQQNERYQVWERYALWGFEQITDEPAYYQDVVEIFTYLDGIMTVDDFLFVWTFDHGSTWAGGVTLVLMDVEITDQEFAAIQPDHYEQRVYWMQQCHSGGFIDDLRSDETVILTSCTENESAGPSDDDYPDGGDPLENEYYAPEDDYYTHGEFNYHVMNAARYETVGYFNFLWEPDTDLNGFTDMLEIYNWHLLKGSRPLENPQYSDDGGIGASILLDIPPYAPQNLALENVNNQCHLTWDQNLEYDLDHYCVYRYVAESQESLPPQAYWPCIGEPEDNEFTDEEFVPRAGGPATAYYYVTAVDITEQESEDSDVVGSHGYYRPESQLVEGTLELSPKSFTLSISPNPFNPETTLRYDLPEDGHVSLRIYNTMGQEVATLADHHRLAGTHTLSWDAGHLPSGVYFANIQAGENHATHKLLLTK